MRCARHAPLLARQDMCLLLAFCNVRICVFGDRASCEFGDSAFCGFGGSAFCEFGDSAFCEFSVCAFCKFCDVCSFRVAICKVVVAFGKFGGVCKFAIVSVAICNCLDLLFRFYVRCTIVFPLASVKLCVVNARAFLRSIIWVFPTCVRFAFRCFIFVYTNTRPYLFVCIAVSRVGFRDWELVVCGLGG